MSNAILNITNWFFGSAILVSSSVAIYGGIRYFLARGDKEKEARAGKMFMCGLVVFLIISFIFVISIVTTPSPFGGVIL